MAHVGTALLNPYPIYEKIGLKEGMRVADLGCGRTGHFIFTSSKTIGDKGIAYAVDIMKDVLENIKSRSRSEGYDNIQVIWSDMEKYGKTPIPEKSLDVCFLVNSLFIMEDKLTVLKEASRLLKKDGYLVIVDWAKNLGVLGPKGNQMIKPDELVALCPKLNIRMKEKFEAGDYHFCIIFQKFN